MTHWKFKFAFLGIGQAVSLLTSSVLQIAIVWYLTEQTGSASVITLSTLAGYLPRAVLGLFTGAFIDRFDRKLIVMLSDTVIALAALALAGMAHWGTLPLWFIYLILCVRSVGAAFHSPALNAIIPTLVPEKELARCAGFLQSFESVSLLISPALAAILFGVWDLSAIVLLDVAGAAVAVSMIFLLPIPKTQKTAATEKLHIFQDTKDAVTVLRSQKGLIWVMVVSAIYAFIYFPIGSMYPLITMTYFGGSVADSSMVEIIFSAGTLAGALFLGMVGSKINKIHAICASIGIYGVGVTVVGLLPPSGLKVFAALSAVLGLTIPFFHGLRTALLQTRIPNEYLGRVLSLAYSISLIATPFGLLLGGTFSEFFGVENCFFACGVMAVLLCAFMIATPSIRKMCDDDPK